MAAALRYCLARSDRLLASRCPRAVTFAAVGVAPEVELTPPAAARVMLEEEQDVTAVITRIVTTVNRCRDARKRWTSIGLPFRGSLVGSGHFVDGRSRRSPGPTPRTRSRSAGEWSRKYSAKRRLTSDMYSSAVFGAM